MLESDSDDSFDSEDWWSWTSIATKGKSCEFERKKEWSWMREQPANPATTTEWYNMVDEQPS